MKDDDQKYFAVLVTRQFRYTDIAWSRAYLESEKVVRVKTILDALECFHQDYHMTAEAFDRSDFASGNPVSSIKKFQLTASIVFTHKTEPWSYTVQLRHVTAAECHIQVAEDAVESVKKWIPWLLE